MLVLFLSQQGVESLDIPPAKRTPICISNSQSNGYILIEDDACKYFALVISPPINWSDKGQRRKKEKSRCQGNSFIQRK